MHHTRRSNALQVVSLTAALLFSIAIADAHVRLDAPNGGETLTAGSTFTVRWHDTVNHGPANYDLWYSVEGADGPWTEITSDLTFAFGADYTFDWTIPEASSEEVRLRVLQDNSGTDYDDISDGDFTIVGGMTTGETAKLTPSRDATLYEGDGSLANGAGEYFFVGRTEALNDAAERRALFAFDIAASIPSGSRILEARLDLHVSRTISGELPIELRRLQETWSEGPSDPPGQEGGGSSAGPGDVTWTHRQAPDLRWADEGGTIASALSAELTVSGVESYSFLNAQAMIDDIQSWLDDPGSNHGWALVAPSAPTGSAKRFNSREHGSAATRPMLVVSYEPNSESPTAEFTNHPLSPSVGETVIFTDQSSGFPTSWSWDFGDGHSSTDRNAGHAYATAGAYSVRLTVSNANGSDSTMVDVSIESPPEPVFDHKVILPAAANVAGEGSSFFVTTADMHNAGSAPATLRLRWLPRNTDNSTSSVAETFTLEPGATRRFQNLLVDAFDLDSGVGAVVVEHDGEDLRVMSRTFNQTGAGTYGQGLAGVPVERATPAGDRSRLLFLTENGSFRSNLGLVNTTNEPIVVNWQAFTPEGVPLTSGEENLPGWGNTQINRLLRSVAPVEGAYVDVWTSTADGLFLCYASVLDAASSDPTTIVP